MSSVTRRGRFHCRLSTEVRKRLKNDNNRVSTVSKHSARFLGDVRSFVLPLFLERDRAGEDNSLCG